MRRYAILVCSLLSCLVSTGKNIIRHPQVKTLQTMVNNNWLSPSVLRLGTDDVLTVAFDELSHNYHRYVCHIERCEVDWTPSQELFESDWLQGFNDIPIENYQPSVNTVVSYTHYEFQIPNSQCSLKYSGNYRLHIIDEDEGEEVASASFMVTDASMSLALQVSSNTDIDINQSHQQLSVSLNYGDQKVTSPEEQIVLVVRQNDRDDNFHSHVPATQINANGLEWNHCRELIFDAGNEYHKFEILDTSHPTLGIDFIRWDGSMFQVYPFTSEPRHHYLYDEDANGSFYIRNSDNIENETSSEYVWVNYRLDAPRLTDGTVWLQGQWTTEEPSNYQLHYDSGQRLYTARILQKQGYYSFQFLKQETDGTYSILPSEGNFFQTENQYTAYIYFKGTGERTWRLTAVRGIQTVSSDRNDRRLR